MQVEANNPEEYIFQLPEERQAVIKKLRNIILENLPAGFSEIISYGMIGYVVPHSKYPKGYHTDPEQPLPFINIASQKNHIAVYHMGLVADRVLLEWFKKEYPKHSKTKLDMGKSCIRFKNPANIPYSLIGELVSKTTVNEWINTYEKIITR